MCASTSASSWRPAQWSTEKYEIPTLQQKNVQILIWNWIWVLVPDVSGRVILYKLKLGLSPVPFIAIVAAITMVTISS